MSKIEPGCRVMFVRCFDDGDESLLGKVATIIGPDDPAHPWPAWTYEGPLWIDSLGDTVESLYTGSIIRIDDIDDDAADLLLAPLPQQDKVPA